ncbi:hypothetical protein BsWGS_10927 [Bradybaena similaris]
MDSENEDKTFTQIIVTGLLDGLQNQKETCDLSDVQVVIDDFEFKCHRVILAACSGFFRAAFSSGMKEDRERKVTLNDISREIFADVLNCMYTGKLNITESNVYELWHAANQLQILFLLPVCEAFLKRIMNAKNCLTIYQHSKLLDSNEMISLSWSCIVNNFKILRRGEEMMMLTKQDIENLINNPDLMTYSEDEVLETILAWVAYKPAETSRDAFSDVPRELVDQHKSDTQVTSQENDKLTFATDVQRNDKEEHSNSLSRVSQLSDLLNLTKVCLLSGQCLIETMNMDIVRADTRAQEILQEAVAYILRTDRYHDLCHTSAIHRASSNLENVIIAATKSNEAHVIVCRRENGQWCGLGNNLKRGYNSTTMTCFNHNIYLAEDSGPMYGYTPSTNQWREVTTFKTTESARCLLSIKNFMFSVFQQGEGYVVRRINATEVSKGAIHSTWVTVCDLPSNLSCIKCSTVIGDKIVFFLTSTGILRIQVGIFDAASMQYFTLNDIPPLTSAEVCFRKGKDSFMLQKDGVLYRISACSEAPFIDIKYETRLWDFNRDIKGAVLFKDELLLFGPSFSENVANEQWELCLPGVFKCVKNITCNERFSCFMHAVVPKMFLTRVVSVCDMDVPCELFKLENDLPITTNIANRISLN